MDRFRIVDQLSGMGIEDSTFFDFSRDGGARTSILGFDRKVGFDRGTRFDYETGFDNRAPFDQGTSIDTRAGFDSVGGFGTERRLRISEERERSEFLFRREERRQFKPEKEESLPSHGEGGSRMESDFTKGETGGDALTMERERLAEELLGSEEEVEIRSFRPTRRAFLFKIAMFATTLLLLLAGTLKGLIPVKFYFFLTILILILWNPLESLLISILIGLTALLAPLLG